MQILERLSFRNNVRDIIITILYTIFVGYGIYMIVITDDVAGKACYGILSIIVLSVALWSEYLRKLYHKAIRTLDMDCNPEQAKEIFNDLLKKDFFKGYKKTVLVFDTLYTLDNNDPQACLDVIQKDEKFFRSSLDNLLIRNYSTFYAYHLLNNRTKTKALYPDVMKMRGAKIKGSKVSPLYNWDFIDAVYYLACKDYKKSLQAFERCNTMHMNQRELVHFYYQYAMLAKEMKNPILRDQNYDKIIAIKGNNAFIIKVKELRGKTYENE